MNKSKGVSDPSLYPEARILNYWFTGIFPGTHLSRRDCVYFAVCSA